MSRRGSSFVIGLILVCCDTKVPHAHKPLPSLGTTPAATGRAQESVRSSLPGEAEGSPSATVDLIPRIESHRLDLSIRRPAEQLLACGALGFVRLTRHGFEGFTYQPLESTWRQGHGDFTHVVAQKGHSYLLLGPSSSLLYYQPNTHLTVLGRVPALGPFEVWPDPRRREWLWVHYLKDDAVHWFELRPLPLYAQLQSTVPLPGFGDSTLSRLSGGEWMYSVGAARGLGQSDSIWMSVRGEQTFPLPSIASETLLITPTSRSDRVWLLAEEGRAVMMEPVSGTQLATVELRGSPFAIDQEGRRLAIVSQRRTPNRRVWAVEVVDERGRHFSFELPERRTTGADALSVETSERDLCLVPERPWVVVGGRTMFQVIDYLKGTEVSAHAH